MRCGARLRAATRRETPTWHFEGRSCFEPCWGAFSVPPPAGRRAEGDDGGDRMGQTEDFFTLSSVGRRLTSSPRCRDEGGSEKGRQATILDLCFCLIWDLKTVVSTPTSFLPSTRAMSFWSAVLLPSISCNNSTVKKLHCNPNKDFTKLPVGTYNWHNQK